jgi:hypothetical protein
MRRDERQRGGVVQRAGNERDRRAARTELRRGSTDSGADIDGVGEWERERGSSGRKRARLWEGEERSSTPNL